MIRLPASVPTRSRAVVHDGLVHAVSVSPMKTPDLYVQSTAALRFLTDSLEAAGSGKDRILSLTVYLTDIGDKAAFNRAWDEWVDVRNPPMRACVGVALEGDDLVELVAVAAVR